MKQCVIVGGASIRRYEELLPYPEKDAFYIYCDSGLRHAERLGHAPDLIVGDFDSGENPHSGTETIVLPVEKDDTDTMFAVKEGIRRGFDDFLMFGVTGDRLDHTLVNVGALLLLDRSGIRGRIVDDYSEMEIVSPDGPSSGTALIDDSCRYFSLLCVAGMARDITVEDAKYTMTGGFVMPEYQYCTGNEVLPGKTARVSVRDGVLLLIRVRHD